MEKLRCFYDDCPYKAIDICNCRFPPTYICELHISNHQNEAGRHIIEEIPANHCLDLESINIILDGDLFTSQSYFIVPGIDIIGFCKLEISNLELPKDYKSAFNSMASTLVKEILSIPRGQTEDIKKNV